MNTIILAGLVKRFYQTFDMGEFDNRLKLQKLIYIIQSSGLNLGYKFRLYLHGPYCTLLSREGFDMPLLNEAKVAYFEDIEYEKKIKKVIEFLGEYKAHADNMEIIASLIFFHKIFPKLEDSNIVNLVVNKDLKFNKREKIIKELLNKIIKSNIFQW